MTKDNPGKRLNEMNVVADPDTDEALVRIAKLERELTEIRSARDRIEHSWRARATLLRAERRLLTTELRKSEDARRELNRRLSDTEQSINWKIAEAHATRIEQLYDYEAERKEIDRQLAAGEHWRQHLESEAQNARAEMLLERARAKELEATVTVLMESWSWRVTAPIRLIIRGPRLMVMTLRRFSMGLTRMLLKVATRTPGVVNLGRWLVPKFPRLEAIIIRQLAGGYGLGAVKQQSVSCKELHNTLTKTSELDEHLTYSVKETVALLEQHLNLP